MVNDSYIKVSDSAATFVGPDAIRLFGAVVVCTSMKFYLETGLRTNRAFGPNNMRSFVETILKKPPYKKSAKGLAQARDDLEAWINAMKAAIPVEPGNTDNPEELTWQVSTKS